MRIGICVSIRGPMTPPSGMEDQLVRGHLFISQRVLPSLAEGSGSWSSLYKLWINGRLSRALLRNRAPSADFESYCSQLESSRRSSRPRSSSPTSLWIPPATDALATTVWVLESCPSRVVLLKTRCRSPRRSQTSPASSGRRGDGNGSSDVLTGAGVGFLSTKLVLSTPYYRFVLVCRVSFLIIGSHEEHVTRCLYYSRSVLEDTLMAVPVRGYLYSIKHLMNG